MTTSSGADMNLMTNTLERKPAETASISDIAETTANACLATRVRQLSRIVTRVYDDAMRPLGITASQYTLLAQLAARDAITAVEIGHELDIEKSTLSRNLKRLARAGPHQHGSAGGSPRPRLASDAEGPGDPQGRFPGLAGRAEAGFHGHGRGKPQYARRPAASGREAGTGLSGLTSQAVRGLYRAAPQALPRMSVRGP